jgi:putative serine protease PepD
VVSQPEGPTALPPGGDHPPPRRPGWIRPFALGLVGALTGVVAYVVVVDPSESADPSATTAPFAAPTTTAPSARAAEVYQRILPSLVLIDTGRAGSEAGGIGSGVVVNDAGQIMTAHHVVRNATSIEVTFSDGTKSPARIVREDPEIDIALLEADVLPQVVVPAVLGSSDALRVGDEAYPVGNPLGLSGSITAGVISGLGRSIAREDGEGMLEGLIQFDAAVNPGSSGGPLLNRDAQVIGIVTALANPTDQRTFIGIGFAVPIATATRGGGGIDR